MATLAAFQSGTVRSHVQRNPSRRLAWHLWEIRDGSVCYLRLAVSERSQMIEDSIIAVSDTTDGLDLLWTQTLNKMRVMAYADSGE